MYKRQALAWFNETYKLPYDDLVPEAKWETLDLTLACGLLDIITGPLKTKLDHQQKQLAEQGKFLHGRQLLQIIEKDMHINEVDVALLDIEALQAVHLRNDNLESFRTRFWSVVSEQRVTPTADLLENLYNKQLKRSEEFKDVYRLYELQVNHQNQPRSFDLLDGMLVKEAP